MPWDLTKLVGGLVVSLNYATFEGASMGEQTSFWVLLMPNLQLATSVSLALNPHILCSFAYFVILGPAIVGGGSQYPRPLCQRFPSS